LHPIRRIEAIKSALGSGEEDAAEIRAAAHLLERSAPVAQVLAAVAEAEFPDALIEASRDRAGSEERAWLTLAAAGARRARQVLAWRASELLDPAELGAVALQRRRVRVQSFERLAAEAEESGASAAWRLLAHLRGSELRSLVRARPALAAAYRRACVARGRVPAPALSPALDVG